MAKGKSELRCKSVRMDEENTSGATATAHIWKWSPDRDIKIKKIFMCLDLPDAQIGTAWAWLSKGSVDMGDPATEPNEEEMIVCGQHITSGTGNPDNVRGFFDFSPEYMEVEEGETLVLSTRQPNGQNLGLGLFIYYL